MFKCVELGCIKKKLVVQAHPTDAPRYSIPADSPHPEASSSNVIKDDTDDPVEVKQISAIAFMREMSDPQNVFSLLLPREFIPSAKEIALED
ncbi:hypothetical protein KEM56_002049 [Ascosphaera pollenicola]|nr:hypothetical protein KEM56_002049 [Ascosphaera pollenicola]